MAAENSNTTGQDQAPQAPQTPQALQVPRAQQALQAPQAQAQEQTAPPGQSRIGYTAPQASEASRPAPSRKATTDGLVKNYLTSANLVLVGLFTFGLVALYLMGMTGKPQTASAEQVLEDLKVDATIEQFRKAQNSATWETEISDVTDTIYYEAEQRQVPLAMLSGNPFVYVPPGAEDSRLPGQGFSGISNDSPLDLSVALARARSLRLQSVLTGSSENRALIDGKMVAEGETISGWTVVSIERRIVVLQWKDQRFELPMPRK